MNKELAKVLRDRLKGQISFVDIYGGLVRVQEQKFEQDGGVAIRKRFPVVVEDTIADCEAYQRDMIPDSSKIGLLYFEDGSTTPEGRIRGRYSYVSTLTLVCWINKSRIMLNPYSEISAMAINEVIDKLRVDMNPENVSFFQGLSVSVSRIPKQDASLFSRYTYDETDAQYLMPPYEYFGIELRCTYRINPDCISQIQIEPTCYDNPQTPQL